MTPVQIGLIRQSFTLVEPIAPQAAALFYDKIFTADPSLRHLFQGNMAQQGSRLMNMIATAVDLLERPDALMPALRKLGARHVNYDVHHAWVALYGVVSTTMMDAARDASSTQRAA